jgi:hypothetical protein
VHLQGVEWHHYDRQGQQSSQCMLMNPYLAVGSVANSKNTGRATVPPSVWACTIFTRGAAKAGVICAEWCTLNASNSHKAGSVYC